MKLAAAVVLAGLGAHILRAAPRPPKTEQAATGPRLGRFFALGAGMMPTNFSSLLLFFPAVHQIGIDHATDADRVLAIVLLFVITLLPAFGPPLVVSVLGDRARPALDWIGGRFARHRQTIGAVICFLFAVLLAVAGVREL